MDHDKPPRAPMEVAGLFPRPVRSPGSDLTWLCKSRSLEGLMFASFSAVGALHDGC